MSRADENLKLDRGEDGLEMEPELREAIGNFKSSVEAWSDAALSRPTSTVKPVWNSASPTSIVYDVLLEATISGQVNAVQA